MKTKEDESDMMIVFELFDKAEKHPEKLTRKEKKRLRGLGIEEDIKEETK